MTPRTADLTSASDTTLVMAISRYDQQALAEVYRRHGGAVFGLGRRLLGDAAVAEELVQEVFLPALIQEGRATSRPGSTT